MRRADARRPPHGRRHLPISPALADDYTGAWVDEVTFVVTIVDARGSLASTDTLGVNSPRSYAATGESAVHVSRVSLRQDETDGDGDGAAGDVGHAAGTLLVTGADRLASLHRAVNLGGSFGMGGDPFAVEAGGEVPGIVHVELVDLQNGALRAAWSSGDILRVRFSTAVNVKAGWPLDGGRDFVDALFGFSEPLGADYSGGWRDASVFVVTAIDVREGTPTVVSNASSGRNTTVQVLGNVRSAAGNGPSAADDDTLTVLGGDFGKTTVPMPVSFSPPTPTTLLSAGAPTTRSRSASRSRRHVTRRRRARSTSTPSSPSSHRLATITAARGPTTRPS